MKATRLIQTGEADPTNTTSAYYRGLAVRALAAAPKSLQKLVDDGYVGEAIGRLSSRDKLKLSLYPADPASFLVLTYDPGSKTISYRYSVQDGSGELRYFKNAASAAREFRRIVDMEKFI